MDSKKTSSRRSKAAQDLSLGADKASQVKGGTKPLRADGELSAGVRFKYDIKAQKED